jgi:UDP-2-acetamido-2,6-beta-L-arabino-hexul-4-ose reductase
MEKITPILITGAQGFLAKNLIATLQGHGFTRLLLVDKTTPAEVYDRFVQQAQFIFHFAGVNRPLQETEFIEGNVDAVEALLARIKKFASKAPLVVASSMQAMHDNPYGRSKKAGEDLVLKFASLNQHPVYIYRFTNIFGKWAKPNYNSVVATFCYNIARNLSITIHNDHAKISLIYVDDVIAEMMRCLDGKVTTIDGILRVLPEYDLSVGDLARTIKRFKDNRLQLKLENQSDPLTKKLYATYLSYVEDTAFIYDLTMHADHRGSFTEMIKTSQEGQISVNISKPGITKGNHYHHTKNEKFIVVSGEARIRFRKVGEHTITEYHVSGKKIQVVDIPPGYAHSIVNVGQDDLITIMWASEVYNPEHPDTYPMEVENHEKN